MENNRFEDSFRHAFAEAEVSPSDSVWTNVELDLEKAAGGKMKRNLLMFQLLAAASVAFAFGIAGLYYLDQPVRPDFTSEPLTTNSAPTNKDERHDHIQKAIDQKRTADGSLKKDVDTRLIIQLPPNPNPISKSHRSDDQASSQSANSSIEFKVVRNELSAYAHTQKPKLVLPQKEEPVEPDPGMVLLARLRDQERRYQEEEKKTARNEKIWASVGFGAGSYKPNVQLSSASLDAISATPSPAHSAESVAGSSYSVGVNIGAKLSKRLIVQGGISYLTQNADFTSTALSHQYATLREFVPNDFDDYQSVSPYSVNSSLQFVSIPVQAGYVIVDRTFGIQLNGGISTDLFISNTLSPEKENYQKVTQSAGKDSPYRTVNFSGLLGTEFSYRIADHYRISLNPGLRYALNSIYKEEVAAEITPVTFDVSLRFKYIFK